MDSRKEGVTHPATPPGKAGRGVQREEALLAVDRSRTNDLCETQM